MTELRPASPLTGKQRRYLRGLGHGLDPVVQMGHQGLTEAVTKAVAEALDHHELIKVRVGKNSPDAERGDRADVVQKLAEAVGGHVVQNVGRVVLMYRQAEEAEDRKVRLPRVPVVEDAESGETDESDELEASEEAVK